MSVLESPAISMDYKALRAATINAFDSRDENAIARLADELQTRANDAIVNRDEQLMYELMATFARLSRLAHRHGGPAADEMVQTLDTLTRTMDHLCAFIAHQRDVVRPRPVADLVLDAMRVNQKPMRNRDIALAVGIKTDYASKVISRLSRTGLIENVQAPAGFTDERAVWRKLTPAGKAAA